MASNDQHEPETTDLTLGRRVTVGVRWIGVSTFVGMATLWITTVVLARLLERSEFGLATMAMVVVAVLALFQDSGLNAALIQRRDRIQEAVDTAAAWAPATGLALAGLCVAAAPLAAYAFDNPDVTNLIRALGGVFVLRSFSIVPSTILQRELLFRRLALISISGSILQAATAITLAALGAGAWSIIAGHLMASGWSALLMWFVCPMSVHPLRASLRELKSLVGYGRYIVAGNIIGYVNANTDSIVVGRALGSAALGTYALGYQTARYTVTAVTAVTNQVVFPAYARLQDDVARFRRAYLRALRFLVAVSAPVALGLIVLSKDVVVVLYGEKWSAAAPVVAIVAVQALILSIASTTGEVFKAAGRPNLFFWIGVLHLLLLVAFIAALRSYGITGFAAARTATTFFVEWLSLTLASRILRIRAAEWIGALRPAVTAAGVMAVGVFATRLIVGAVIPTESLPVVAGLVLEGTAVYLIALRLISPADWHELAREVGSILGARAARARLSSLSLPIASARKGRA
jgi:PST family polysaccharide transporter